MTDEPSRHESRQEAQAGRVESIVARLAILFQAAAVIWLACLWHRNGPTLPGYAEAALWVLSWLTMIGASLVVAVVARRSHDLRLGPILCGLLWAFLGLLLMIVH